MTSKTIFYLILILGSSLSCNKTTPAGFWKTFKKEFLKVNLSKQGPYGGHRALHWKADQANTFIPNDIIDFANKNGWTLVDSLEFNKIHTDKWLYLNNPIFPLSHTGLNESLENNSTYEKFPRWFGKDIKAYTFKSGWITINPGTDDFIEENGFVITNSDRTEMAVYHLWGE